MPKPARTWIQEIDASLHRTLAQIAKAARRGDIDAMFRWLETLERQIGCASRIDGLLRRDHRPRAQPALPKKEPAKLRNAQGVEINPYPENELRAAREYAERRWRAQLAAVGLTPRPDRS